TAVKHTHNFNKQIAAHAHGTNGIGTVIHAGVDTIEHCSWLHDGQIKFKEDYVKKIVEKDIYICTTKNSRLTKVKRRIAQRAPQLKRMKEMGVKFIFGTDAGITNVPHNTYVQGLETMEEIGMSNEEIIESATLLAAKGLG